MSWRASTTESRRRASSLEGTGAEKTGLAAARARRTVVKSMAGKGMRVKGYKSDEAL